MAPAMDFVRGRPALVVAVSQVLRLVVPFVAKLAGNVDPDENAISHVFGQQTICVAMDFPGWWEAACTSFLVAGLMDAFAFAQLYRIVLRLRYGEDDVPKMRRGLLATFCMLMALMSNSFSLIYLMDNPVATPTANSALWHSVPYVMLQIQRTFFIMFLLACLRSNDAIASVKVAWHAAAVITVASYVMAVIGIALTFAEMSENGMVKHLREEDFDYPYERYKFLGVNEYIFTFGNLLTMLLHPLGLRGGPAEAPGKHGTVPPPVLH